MYDIYSFFAENRVDFHVFIKATRRSIYARSKKDSLGEHIVEVVLFLLGETIEHLSRSLRVSDVSDFGLVGYFENLVDHSWQVAYTHIKLVIVVLCGILAGVVWFLRVIGIGEIRVLN